MADTNWLWALMTSKAITHYLREGCNPCQDLKNASFPRCAVRLTRATVSAGQLDAAAVCIDTSKGVEGILAQLGMEAHLPAFHKVCSILLTTTAPLILHGWLIAH